MRYVCFVLVSLIFFQCTQKNKNSNAAETVKPVTNDTFSFYDDNMLKHIPVGFKLDTINQEDKAGKYTSVFIKPILVQVAYAALEKKLQQEILRRKDGQMTSTDTISKAIETHEQVYLEISPLSIYKNKRLISYGFLHLYTEEGRMRPFRSYFSVNYDIAKKEFINFDGFFNLVSAADSNAVKHLVLGEIGNPDLSWCTLNNDIVFSVDDEHVYFYFDMFGIMGNPMGLVKEVNKKYLYPFIRDAYK